MDTLETMDIETLKPKIPFYVRRTFGEKMNACFDFIKENFKPLLKYCTYFVLPLALVQSISMNSFMSTTAMMQGLDEMGSIMDSAIWGIIANYFFLMLCYLVGTVLLTAVVYSLVQLYNSRENRLQNIEFADIKPNLIKNIKRVLIVMLFTVALTIVACIVLGVLAALTPLSLLLTIPGLIACMIPLMLMTPIYIFENIGVIDAFTKSIKMGFATWGGVFAMAFVTGLIASVVQGAATTPWYVATIVQYFFALNDGTALMETSVVQKFFLYILGVIQVYGTYIAMIISLIGMIYQYSHSSDLIDSTSVVSDIDNFEQL